MRMVDHASRNGPRRRVRAAGALASIALAFGCNGELPAPVTVPPGASRVAVTSEAPDSVPLAAGVRVDTIARHLAVPWAIAFAPDGRTFVTERAGRVRIIENGALRAEPWATLDVYADEPSIFPEAGLMGIALAPDFASSRAVYLLATHWRDGAARSSSLPARLWRRARGFVGTPPSRWVNRVHRCTDNGGRASDCRVVVDGLPASFYHAGGALAFGPDGMLYLTLGDALDPDASRGPRSLAARILRYTPGGNVPADNPVPRSPVWASGLRNSQGIAWHPETHDMFALEHGPSGMPQERMRAGNDELNVIVKGAHYGWPDAIGADSPMQPLRLWRVAIAPGGLAFYSGGSPSWRGSLFIGGLRGRTLRRLTVARGDAGWSVTGEEELLRGTGRIRAVAMAPDGSIWVTTSNRDHRGPAGPSDDLVLRLTPAAAPAVRP